MTRKLKFWGWGYEDTVLSAQEIATLEAFYAKQFGIGSYQVIPTPRAEEIQLRAPRLAIPAALAGICSTDHHERLLRSYGKSFFDSVRIFARDFSNPPDVIALPRNEQDVVDVLDWCERANATVIPVGGNSSVVAGTEPPKNSARSVVSLDLRELNKVVEIDTVSQAARIQAGTYGPSLEAQLKPSGLTLRHFPQSFEFSSLGGWIATRGGGHYCTLYTHIDEFVESLRVVTPRGTLESRRLPGSGAGPSPDRMFIGSEGILGVITEAWIRLRPRPTFRAATSVRFKDIYAAADAVRGIAQAHLYPANCRVLDAGEAWVNGAGDGTHAVLVLAFESADHPLETRLARALEICAAHGGQWSAEASKQDEHRAGAAGQWRDSFLRMPYNREALVPRGIIVETFESAITWERFKDFHENVMSATRRAVKEATGRDGIVTCRFTHVYPDGPAPYYSVHALGKPGQMLEQCWQIKTAASEALMKAGGTITHHHAVGRDHRRWYDQQRPEVFAQALRAAKKSLDPNGLLNPGVLIDP